MTPLENVLSKLPDARPSGSGYQAKCPAHDDRKPSLSVGTNDAGDVLLDCKAGCDTSEVAQAMGLEMKDLFAQSNSSPPARRSRQITIHPNADHAIKAALWGEQQRNPDAKLVETYDYGEGIKIVRCSNKAFLPVHLNGEGWSVGKPDSYPLYRQAEISDAGESSFIFFTEGEKDADNLAAAGLVATTMAGGANGIVNNLQAIDLSFLAGRHIVLMPDNDTPGRECMAQVAIILEPIAESVRILELHGLPDKGDVSDWLDTVGDAEELVKQAEEASVYKQEAAYAGAPTGHGAPRLIRMSDVSASEVSWLWPGRIPMGRLTLLVGRPGCGKSFLTAYLAATVSQGFDWSDSSPCPRGSVVLCSAEDDPADTIAPRLIGHNADQNRIHLLAGVISQDGNGDSVDRMFTLADLDSLRHTLEHLGDCKLIVIDPIGSYLGGRTDAHRDNEVRGVLAPACKIASDYGAALVVVAHTRKGLSSHADDMAMGSRAFTGIARSVLHLMKDPRDESGDRRLLLPGKNNLSEEQPGLAFEIGPGCEDRPSVQWHEGEVSMTADEAINLAPHHEGGQPTERDEAKKWLQETLAAGPMPSREIFKLAKEEQNITKRTLERAKEDIKVEAYRPKNPGPWFWRLPNDEAQRQSDQCELSGDLAVCPPALGMETSSDSDYTSPDRHAKPLGHVTTAFDGISEEE